MENPAAGRELGASVSAEALLDIVRQVAAELHPGRGAAPSATLDSTLERDLGFDSLGRVELLARLESDFGVSLPETVVASAETPRDLLRALLAAQSLPPAQIAAAERAAALAAETETPDAATTLLEVLEWHLARHPDRPHIVLQHDDGSERTLSYGELAAGARRLAAGLLERGLEPGHTVAIMLPTSAEYFFSFLGVQLAGGVPVPIYPPARASQIEEHLRRHAAILSNARVRTLITVPEAKPIALLLRSRVTSLEGVVAPAELAAARAPAAGARAGPHDIAMLQYTSGSTGSPKGVIVTHANLLANLRAMAQVLRVTPNDVFVSWLPLYHDMGLIGAWLGSLTYGFKFPVMSPLAFLARPERWLWAIHRHGGTISGGPNFCYELCLRRIEEERIRGLDLASWRIAFNGAEPVSPETMENFSRRFARYGFRPEAMAPVYGLAEATLGVALPPPGRGPRLDRVERERFMRSGRALPADPSDSHPLVFVSCGPALPGHQVRVVDAAGRELPEREEGHVQFSGPSATSGYYRNPEQTRELLRDGWLDTGDLGYIAEGELYITGRAKDVIIRAGRNIYPYELEEAIGDIEGIRRGCVAVFGIADERTGTERIVALAETRETDAARREALRARVNETAIALIGAPLDDVVLVAPHTVLKTSSGKIRRAASRELYLAGGHAAARAVWWQLARFAWSALLPQARRALRAAADLAYGLYAGLLLVALGTVTWLGCAAVPRVRFCWALTHRIARLFFALARLPLAVRGLDNLPRDRPCVLVANHASYLDGLVLAAALREPGCFVAKRELLEHRLAGLYTRRIGAVFVERFDVQRGTAETARMVEALRVGFSLIVFPEGTFRRMPGLLPFRMGAFVAAAQAAAPVVPVTLRGTRSALREGQWLLRRARLSVTVSAPLEPQGSDWSAAIRLRDAARAEILRLCAEPDLGEEIALGPKRGAVHVPGGENP